MALQTEPALAFPVSVIDLIGASTVLRLLTHCGLICWPLFSQEPRMLLLSYIRQLLSLYVVAIVGGCYPKSSPFLEARRLYLLNVYASSALSRSH